jgi:predicted secreted protein
MTTSERDHGSVGALASWPGRPGHLGDDELPGTLSELFRGKAVYDGTGMIKLELPHIVAAGAPTLMSVAVNWQMVLANAVARLYLIADLNAVPLLARITLPPDIVPPHLSLEVRLEAATHVRALVQCGDGTALQVKRWVWVIPGFGSADSEPAGGPCPMDRGARSGRPGRPHPALTGVPGIG